MSNPFSAKPGQGKPELPAEQGSQEPPAEEAVAKPSESTETEAASPEPKQKVEKSEELSPVKAVSVEPKPVEPGPLANVSPPPAALGMDEVSCRTCRYLKFEGTSRVSAHEGECRRNAPSPGANQVASWPQVTWEGWCGEWESGVSDEDMVKMARAIADRQAEGVPGGFVKKPAPDSNR